MNTRMALIAASILIAAPLAQAAPAKHALPLHPGFYVDADVPCGEANMGGLLQMMGDRFEFGHELCTIKSMSRHGDSYTATDECQNTDTGRKHSGKLTMVIPDDRTVVFTAAQPARYRYCPISSMPSVFKDAHEMVPDTPPFHP